MHTTTSESQATMGQLLLVSVQSPQTLPQQEGISFLLSTLLPFHFHLGDQEATQASPRVCK